MSSLMKGGGLLFSAAAIAVGSGLIVPIGATAGGLLDMMAIAIAMVCVGLADGA